MRFFTTVHILLLLYIITALIFWGISLHKQSLQIYELEKTALNVEISREQNAVLYDKRLSELKETKSSRTSQYIGEGSTFLLIILIGAAIVYSSFRRSIRLSRQQNNFMLSVTHELKSPIAAMKLNLQTLERHNLDQEKKQLLVDRCVKEANRLNDLCNNMLLASQIEGRQYKQAKETLDYTELVDESIRDYAVRYPNRFEQDDDFNDVSVAGDRILLQLAVNNLLENAVKYTPADKPIHISLKKKNGVANLQVKDQGVGIDDSEKGKIFNKFYRVGNEETRKSKGTGLGLYLTAKIVRQHKGKISVRDNTPNGAIFEISLPLA